MGMTYDQYWRGETGIHTAYREAYELELSRKNQFLWLQGRYFYDALCAASPILRAFSKATKPMDYTKDPYPITQKDVENQEEREQRERYERIKERVSLFAEAFNARRKEENHGGGNDGTVV